MPPAIPIPETTAPELYIQLSDPGTSFMEWLGTSWWWIGMLTGILWLVLYPVRRYFRELRRRERWSLEKATWAQSGFHPTRRILKRWGRTDGGHYNFR